MPSGNTSSSRTCPVCDAPNSTFSLFCSECGATLNGPVPSSSSTSYGGESPYSASQDTAAFVPIGGSSQPTVSHHAPPSSALQNPGRTTTSPSTVTGYPGFPGQDTAPAKLPVPNRERESVRGFFLGLTASVLILAVLLLWVWAAVLDTSTRDSISDLFGFIG